MSGHSHFAGIKHKKAAQDGKLARPAFREFSLLDIFTQIIYN